MNELELERRLTHVEGRAKSNTHRLEEVERKQEDITALVQAVAVVAQKQADMDKDLQEIKADVKQLTAKPGRRWDSLAEKALLAAVAGLVGYVFIKLGLA